MLGTTGREKRRRYSGRRRRIRGGAEDERRGKGAAERGKESKNSPTISTTGVSSFPARGGPNRTGRKLLTQGRRSGKLAYSLVNHIVNQIQFEIGGLRKGRTFPARPRMNGDYDKLSVEPLSVG